MKIEFLRSGSTSSRAGKTRIALFALLAITAIIANTAHAAVCTPSLYGTSYDGRNDPATFRSIDIATGASSQIGPTGFNRISAMDLDPTTGILYAVAELPPEDPLEPLLAQKVLISIDRETGAGTQIAELSFGINLEYEHIAGMSFDSSGTLYGYGSRDQGFYTIDVLAETITTLGVNVPVPGAPVKGNALAFSGDDDDILYHLGNATLNTVNLTSGQLTKDDVLVIDIAVDPHGFTGMDYAPETGSYYAILKDGAEGERILVTINVDNYEVDRIGSYTSDFMDALTYICEPNQAPEITSNGGGPTAALNAAENQTAVTTVTATDADLPPQTLTFSISDGADKDFFTIDGVSGVLTFISPPNFDNPLDDGLDNVYNVQVTVTDDGAPGPNLTDMQDIAVTVTDEPDDLLFEDGFEEF